MSVFSCNLFCVVLIFRHRCWRTISSSKKRINQKVCLFLLLNVHIHVNIFSLYFLLNEHSISVLSTIDYFHFSSANNALFHSRSHSKPSHSLTPSRCCYYSLFKSAAWIFLQSWTIARAHTVFCYAICFMYIV